MLVIFSTHIPETWAVKSWFIDLWSTVWCTSGPSVDGQFYLPKSLAPVIAILVTSHENIWVTRAWKWSVMVWLPPITSQTFTEHWCKLFTQIPRKAVMQGCYARLLRTYCMWIFCLVKCSKEKSWSLIMKDNGDQCVESMITYFSSRTCHFGVDPCCSPYTGM